MKSLLAKILLALVATTLLALLVTGIVSRAALQRGFVQFLEQQEERHLEVLAPELASHYRRTGSWATLRGNPRYWLRLLARSRPEGVVPPEGGLPERARPPLERGPQGGTIREEVRNLWQRLFVLDANRDWVAGARYDDLEAGESGVRLAPVEVDGRAVGWVGFRPTGVVAAPEARRFLAFQRRALFASLIVALLFATGLGFWLARNIARPVGRVRESVNALTAGDFGARTGIDRRDEIGQLARHVDRLAETLERNRTARRRWTADVAHELRTPVAILRGELDAVRDGVRPLEPGTLESLHEEIDHLSRLVDDLQTLALADAGALEFRFEPVELGALLRQVVDAFAERLAAAGLRLDSRLPERVVVRGDPQRLRQLAHNLVENACRYTAPGGTVRVSLTAAGGRAELLVEDSAPGVTPNQRSRLFERFYRAEGSRVRSSGGSGLGLSICREIALAHGGELEAGDSELGGLAVRFRLPLE